MALRRLEGWEARLNVYVEASRHRPFDWGKHDCALFAAGAIEAVTGTPLVDIPAYSGVYEAARALKCMGHRDVIDLANAHLRPWQSVLMARRADIALLSTEHGLSLGVVLGASVAGPGVDGLMFSPLQQASKAWRVGD